MVVYWPRSFRREGLVEGRVRIQMNHHVAGSSREEPRVAPRPRRDVEHEALTVATGGEPVVL